MVSLVKPPVDASSESEERMATETENVGLSAFTESFFFASELTCTLKHDKTTYIK